MFIRKAMKANRMVGPGEFIRKVHGRGRVQIPERIRRLWGIRDGDLVVWIPPEAGQQEARIWPGRIVRKEPGQAL